jgi:virginiamycin B lyase
MHIDRKKSDSFFQDGSEEKRLQRHIPIGISCLLLLIILGGICVYLYKDEQQMQASAVHKPRPHQTPVEHAEIMQRAQSIQAHRASTKTNPWGIALDEQHGFAWVAEPGCEMAPLCQTAFPTGIGKYALADDSLITTYQEPAIVGAGAYSNPLFVQVSPDGHVWFTEPNSDAIGELDPDEGRYQQWKTAPGSAPYDLVFDANGNLWFTELTGSSIGFFNTRTHQIVETPTPTTDSHPYGITIDHQGHIWFAENEADVGQIGTFRPTLSGIISITEYQLDDGAESRPHLITADRQDNIWVSDGFSGTISRFSPTTGATTHYTVALPCRRTYNCTHISGISADAQGHIWFTDSLNATVGYLIPASGQVKARLIADPTAHPHDGLVLQSNGTVWFTEQYGEQQFGPALIMWPRIMVS